MQYLLSSVHLDASVASLMLATRGIISMRPASLSNHIQIKFKLKTGTVSVIRIAHPGSRCGGRKRRPPF